MLVSAAGLGVGVATPAVAGNWSGFYIGAGGSVQVVTSEARSHIDVSDLDTFGHSSDDDFTWFAVGDLAQEGIFGTLEGGFDWRWGNNNIIGFVGDYTFGDMDASSRYENCADGSSDANCFGTSHGLELEDSASILARIGHIYNPNTLFYLLAGYTVAKFEQNSQFDACENSDTCLTGPSTVRTNRRSDWEGGFTVGGGVEKKIADNFTAKFEYRFTDFGAFGNPFSANPCTPGVDVGRCFGDTQFDPRVHALRAAVVVRPGSSGPENGPSAGPGSIADWTGFFIGGGGGLHALVADGQSLIVVNDLDTANFSSNETVNALIDGELGDEGFFGTLEGGFDWRFGNSTKKTIGFAADWSISDTKASRRQQVCHEEDSSECLRITDGIELEQSVSILARLGHVYSANTFFYGLLGYTVSKFKHHAQLDACEDSLSCLVNGSPVFTKTWGDTSWEDGITFGGGVEKKIGTKLGAKFEYRYTDYDAFGEAFSDNPCVAGADVGRCTGFSDFDPSVHTFRAALTWRFNRSGPTSN